MRAKTKPPVIDLEPPWYRCENGSEFRGMTSKPPSKCPVCGSTEIEMVIEVDPQFGSRKKDADV